MKMERREAVEGEKIVIVERVTGSDYQKGSIFTVYEVGEDSVEVEEHNQEVFHSEYEVLVEGVS